MFVCFFPDTFPQNTETLQKKQLLDALRGSFCTTLCGQRNDELMLLIFITVYCRTG